MDKMIYNKVQKEIENKIEENLEKSKWNDTERKLKIGIDLDDTLFVVL